MSIRNNVYVILSGENAAYLLKQLVCPELYIDRFVAGKKIKFKEGEQTGKFELARYKASHNYLILQHICTESFEDSL